MSPGRAKDKLLTVGEVARLAGCSPDTVRTWDREGLLTAQRTQGNQRRFIESEVVRFIQAERGSKSTPAPSVTTDASVPAPSRPRPGLVSRKQPSQPSWFGLSPLEMELQDEAASLELLRLRKEKDALARAMELEAREQAARNEAEQARVEAKRRLDALRSHGRGIARDLPVSLQASIAADLEMFVNPTKFPASLDESDARAFVRARVDQHRSRFRESESQAAEVERRERARAAEIERREQARARLIASGKDYASRAVFWWCSEDKAEATREVERELAAHVRWDWQEDKVKQLVDEILDDLIDESDDDDDDDEDNED